MGKAQPSVFTSVSVVVGVSTGYGHVSSAAVAVGDVSDADALRALPLIFSFLQGETMNEDICLDTCVVYVGMPGPGAQVQNSCAGLLLLQGGMHGCLLQQR